MSYDFEKSYIDGRKFIKKLYANIDTFSYDKEQGKLVLSKAGDICFVKDIIRLLEKEMK
jgi:hypothetical protein